MVILERKKREKRKGRSHVKLLHVVLSRPNKKKIKRNYYKHIKTIKNKTTY